MVAAAFDTIPGGLKVLLKEGDEERELPAEEREKVRGTSHCTDAHETGAFERNGRKLVTAC